MNRRLILIFIFFTVVLSCEKGYITECQYCYDTKPTAFFLEIFISSSAGDPVQYTVTVYEGDIEDNIVWDTYFTSNERLEVEAFLYKKYTAVVEYNLNGQSYRAVDSAMPQIRYEKTSCEYPCYYVYGNIIDLRLRYSGM